MEMTQEEKQAYEWALNQEFNSVAARYARVLAKYIESMEAAQQSAQRIGCTGATDGDAFDHNGMGETTASG